MSHLEQGESGLKSDKDFVRLLIIGDKGRVQPQYEASLRKHYPELSAVIDEVVAQAAKS